MAKGSLLETALKAEWGRGRLLLSEQQGDIAEMEAIRLGEAVSVSVHPSMWKRLVPARRRKN